MNEKILITKVKTTNGTFGTPVTTNLSAVFMKLRNGSNAAKVRDIAETASYATLNDMKREGHLSCTNALPYLFFSAVFGKEGLHDVRHRTGLVLLSIDCPEGLSQIRLLKERVAQLPYTLMAFTGSSQKTLKVVVRCQYGDGYEPQSNDEYELFLEDAHQTASRLYEVLADCKVQPAKAGLLMGCRMSSDESAVYHADAQPVVVVRQSEQAQADIRLTKQGDVMSKAPVEESERLRMEYYACLDKAAETAQDAEELVQALAHYCHKAHLPEEMCVQNTMLRWTSIPISDDLKRRIFRSVYKKPFSKERPVSQMNDKERMARFIKDFFDRRYELRYNEVKQQEEFRPKTGTDMAWLPLTKRDLKRIAFEEMMEGGYGWSVDIETYVQSSLVRSYNPITEFLYATKSYYDPKRDYIGELARRVPTDYADWEKFFHRWFLAMVAQWLRRNGEHGNAVVPMLIGRQGTHKTSFCKLLLPRSLQEYFMDDIKMENAEQAERVLGRMALVNIDEYNAKTDREQAKIKRLLSERDVQVRRMRSDQYTMTRRLCSFIATTNEPQPLPGGDGTRRYLCTEVTGIIDIDTPIDYRRLYAQAMHEIDSGQPFRFYPDEEAAIQEHNRPYQQHSSSSEALLSFFAPAPRSIGHFMKAVDIQAELSKHLRSEDVPNIKQLTITLKRCGFCNGALNGQRGWYVSRIES